MNSISVVVPIYYGEKYIPDIICQIEACSAYLGTKDYIEILFVNDAPDAPLSQKWKSDSVEIIVINSAYNSGIHGARVKGFIQCQGDYVLFLDQDDKIKPEYFYSQLQAIGEGDAVLCKGLNGEKEFYTDDNLFTNSIKKEFVLRAWNMIISPGQVLIRRKSVPHIWTENIMHYNGADDWFLWICMMASGNKFSLNDNILYEHVLQESNASNDIVNMLESEQELIHLIQEEKVLSHNDFQLLMEGFFRKNIRRTQELYYKMNSTRKKLDVLDTWVKLKKKNVKYSDFLLLHKIKTVAIYGCGILGEYLYVELKETLEVKFFIDKNAKRISQEIPVYSLHDTLPEAEAIIISLIGDTEKVESEIRKKGYKVIFIFKDWIMDRSISKDML